ncbi:ABC transporter permease [Marinomonas spartinae]|uniref:ABC transporter permease n=1 Tax=Marinomonas spartinae TaxID=1792290 RepID=UPI0018F26A04|nr:ABC transporter permease subunit [Marinomonas spartinae]MBJ7554580.1 ABC transporter permease subunit [Marinomonas spartinae]
MNKQTLLAYCLLLPGLGLIIVFIFVIISMALAQSVGYFNFSGSSTFTWQFWQQILADHQLSRAFFYSLKIATISAILSVSFAYPLALWLRDPFRGSQFVSSLLKAPLLVHGLVAAFLYVNFISFNGFLNQIFVHLGLVSRPIRMQNDSYGIGVIILQVWKQMPFALLLLTGAVQSIGHDITDAAKDLGAGAWTRFVKIILPLTLKALQAALIIIFIGAAGDYSFQIVAGPIDVSSLAQLMLRIQANDANGWNLSATVAILLMLTALIGSALLALITQQVIKWGAKR